MRLIVLLFAASQSQTKFQLPEALCDIHKRLKARGHAVDFLEIVPNNPYLDSLKEHLAHLAGDLVLFYDPPPVHGQKIMAQIIQMVRQQQRPLKIGAVCSRQRTQTVLCAKANAYCDFVLTHQDLDKLLPLVKILGAKRPLFHMKDIIVTWRGLPFATPTQKIIFGDGATQAVGKRASHPREGERTTSLFAREKPKHSHSFSQPRPKSQPSTLQTKAAERYTIYLTKG